MAGKIHTPFGDDDVVVWAEPGGPIMLRVIDRKYGDPVELNEHQAIELAELLRTLAAEIAN